jgi:hypothetical protein
MRKAGLATVFAAIALVAIVLSSSSATAPRAVAAGAAPSVTTGYAVGISPTSEKVLGVLNPHGQATNFHFDYGSTTSYGTGTGNTKAGASNANRGANAVLNGLTPGATYHYRLVATNASGTTFGGDQTFIAGQTTSAISVFGREGFVSPGRVIGVELGCIGGQTGCTGNVSMTHGGVLIGQHSYSYAANTGGFRNMKLTDAGWKMVKANSVWHLLEVNVQVNASNGQTLNFTIHLARWVWH